LIFPKFLANSLIAFTELSNEFFKKEAIETIRLLALANLEVCAHSGGIKLLIESVLDTSISEMSESIIYSLLFLLNEPKNRNIIKIHLDFPKLFSIFTDVDFPMHITRRPS